MNITFKDVVDFLHDNDIERILIAEAFMTECEDNSESEDVTYDEMANSAIVCMMEYPIYKEGKQ